VFFGSPETTTGGKALKFYASVRIDVRRIQTLKEGADSVGNRTKAKIVKNKMAPPFKVAEFDIIYGQGISREGGIIDMGVEHGIIKKSGSWFTYDGDQLGQGMENSRRFLRDNPELAAELERLIKEKLGVGTKPADAEASPKLRTVRQVRQEPVRQEPVRQEPVRQGPDRQRPDPCGTDRNLRRTGRRIRRRWRVPSSCAS
jgi:recombination protein RecA